VKQPRILPGSIRPSTRERGCGDICSLESSLPHRIVRFVPLPTDGPISLSFIWSAVTINLNRSLHLRRADVKHYLLAGNSIIHRAASPFGLYRASTGPDFDQDALDEFDGIMAKVDDESKPQSFEILSRRPREISICLGKTGKCAYCRQNCREKSLPLPHSFRSSAIAGHPGLASMVHVLPLHPSSLDPVLTHS
jgi:hypothetical protein